jgi:hypothetical protein
MIEEAGGCFTSLIRGTVYVLGIVIGAVVIFALLLLALAAVYWYLNFLLSFDAIGVLIGLLAPVILCVSSLYFLAWLANNKKHI